MEPPTEVFDRDDLLRGLVEHGVAGAEDFGRFVSNVTYLRPSNFDERAAMPVLIDALPRVHDPVLASTIASHLRRAWARPAAYEALLSAFKRFGVGSSSTGWAIGDSLASAATTKDAPELLRIVTNERFGTNRQMIVFSLHRFKSVVDVAAVLKTLTEDSEVSLHAMSAYRRTVGNEVARVHFEELRSKFPASPIARQAEQQITKIDKRGKSQG